MGPADDVDTDFVASEARRHPAIEDFVLWLTVERGRSSNTLAAYGRDLARYQAHLARQEHDEALADLGRRLQRHIFFLVVRREAPPFGSKLGL